MKGKTWGGTRCKTFRLENCRWGASEDGVGGGVGGEGGVSMLMWCKK